MITLQGRSVNHRPFRGGGDDDAYFTTQMADWIKACAGSYATRAATAAAWAGLTRIAPANSVPK